MDHEAPPESAAGMRQRLTDQMALAALTYLMGEVKAFHPSKMAPESLRRLVTRGRASCG